MQAGRTYSRRRVGGDFCTVCGKPATGIHYKSVSCNGCRSFFRRSVANNKMYECKDVGYDRKSCFTIFFCKKCRLELCLAAGMDPDAVRMEEREDDEELPDDLQAPVLMHPSPSEGKQKRMMNELVTIEDAHHRLRISTFSPPLVAGLTIDDFIGGHSKLGMAYEPMHSRPYSPASIQLVPAEVIIRHRIHVDFTDFDYHDKKLWLFQDVIYTMEYIKALPIYHLLEDCSKRALLASAISCANFTTAYYSYCQRSDRTCYPDGSVLSWNREMLEQSPDSTHFHTALIAAIREVKLDLFEYALLKMIIVCNPMLEGLCPYDCVLIQHEKERCTKALLSYVLARRGVSKGPAFFTEILSIAGLAMRLTSWQKSQHMLIMAMGLYKHRIPFVETIVHSL